MNDIDKIFDDWDDDESDGLSVDDLLVGSHICFDYRFGLRTSTIVGIVKRNHIDNRCILIGSEKVRIFYTKNRISNIETWKF